jgi:hypothetical protein
MFVLGQGPDKGQNQRDVAGFGTADVQHADLTFKGNSAARGVCTSLSRAP